jgi:pimeloyl-ACP methyl ester carboxylesterase
LIIVKIMSDLVIDVGDVTIRAMSYGAVDAPLALCLHGFPDTAHTFRLLAPRLAERGYHVVAPFARGYAPSSPSASNNYQLVSLAHDALVLHDRLGGDEHAIIVGHDWGASAAYVATSAEPARWAKAVTIALPPLALFAESLGSFDQLRRSWYMFYFQQSFAEVVVAQNDFDFLERLWKAWSPNYEPDADLAFVRQSLGDMSHLHAALEYYSAMFATSPITDPSLQTLLDAALRPSDVATLYLHGANDGCIAPLDATKVRACLSAASKYEVLPDAGHFLHLEQPDAVRRAIDAFLDD